MPLLEIEHVTKRYRARDKKGVLANDDISIEVAAGEVFGLLGPNGAGKTTLVSQVLTLLTPTSGTIRIDGTDIVEQPSLARQACSFQPQTSVPIDRITPLEALDLVGRIRGGARSAVRARADALIDALDLGEWRDERMQLSGGVTRLVAFCMAAVVPGRIVILDEPTNDVDPLRRKLLWQQVRAMADAGSAVVLVTHNVLEAERCVDRLAILDGGRVVGAGTPAELKTRLGRGLQIEVVFDVGVTPELPAFVEHATSSGRRLFAEISDASIGDAMRWAQALRDGGVIEEFSIGPATLEDVYVRHVASQTDPVPA
ncbi:MAG: ABC transporter ATP-binding protein [Actinomycetota bacterium]